MIGDHPLIRRPLAKVVRLSRSSLYYRPKQPEKDWALKQKIEEVLREYPSYSMIKFFLLAILASLICKALRIREITL